MPEFREYKQIQMAEWLQKKVILNIRGLAGADSRVTVNCYGHP